MNDLTDILIKDVRNFASFLLESWQEMDKKNFAATPAPISTITGVLFATTFLYSWLPRLLKEAMQLQFIDERLDERALLPLRAKPPRQPWAYKLHGENWVPDFWLRPKQRFIIQNAVLQWLMSIIEDCLYQVRWFYNKIDAQYEEVRGYESSVQTMWSKQAQTTFFEIRNHLKQAEQRLLSMRQQVQALSDRKIRPRAILPTPYPSGKAWRTLRLMERYWRDETLSFPKYLDDLLFGKQLNSTEVAFLYQRWCTIKLIERWEALGWHPQKPDTVPWAVFLGGLIELTNEKNTTIQLWIEPRLTKLGHDCGLYCDQKLQLTPDIVINIPVRDGYESIILDPTLATDNASLEQKGKYIKMLHRNEVKIIAGVRVIKRPLRSWAMAPLKQKSCRILLDFDGRYGAIPMNPVQWSPDGLDAFLMDLINLME